jgi:hypothetical protein
VFLFGDFGQPFRIRLHVRRQPHRGGEPAIDEVHGAVCEPVASERARDLGHHTEVHGGIRKRPSRHRVAAERQGDDTDGCVLLLVVRRTHVNGQHRATSIEQAAATPAWHDPSTC